LTSSTRSFLALLAPHALPRVPALVAVVAVGAIANIGLAAALMLVDPLWDSLFPGAASPVAAAASGAQDASWVDALKADVRDGMVALASALADGEGAEAARTGMLRAAALVLGVLGVVSGLAQFAFVYLSRWVALRMVVDLRVRLVRHLMGLPLRYHGRRSFGDLLSRIGQDVNQALLALDVALKDLISEPVQAVAFLAVAIMHAPSGAGPVVAVVLVAVAIPVAVFAKRVRKRSSTSLTELGASVQTLAQMFAGVRTVKGFRAEQRELDAYERQSERYLAASMRMVRTIATSRALTATLSLLGFAAILVAAGLAVDPAGGESIAGVTVFIVAIAQVYSRVKRTTHTITRVQEAMGASHRLREVLDERADAALAGGTRTLANGLGAGIALEGVTVRFGDDDAAVLERADLVVRPGETLAVVGPSGAGKSTLLDLVARLLVPTEGRVLVDGVDLREVDADAWSRLVAIVDQQPFLFHTTIRENLRYARPDATDAEVEAAARAADVHDFVASLPRGYDTDVEDGGARLSGGQRQRLAIARALLKGAPLLLLDEPTSALDEASERAVARAIDELMADRTAVVRTAIVVAHRPETIKGADRVVRLERGRFVEQYGAAHDVARDDRDRAGR